MQGEYELAEKYFYQTLNNSANPIPDYFALSHLYIETNQLQKAKEMLQKIPMKESINRYAVYSDLYEIAKLEGKFEQALNYLEQYTEINDSLSIASNESKILEIENRYKHQKLMTENRALDLLRLPQADGKETPAATSRPARYTQPPAGAFHRNGTEKRPAETFGRRGKGTGTDAQRNGNTDRTLPYPAEKHAGKLACI